MWHAIRHTTLTDGLATSLALVHAEFKRILCTIASERLRRHSMTAIFAIAWCIWHMCRYEDERIKRITGVRVVGAARHALHHTVQMALGCGVTMCVQGVMQSNSGSSLSTD